jgi:hypothetical protein
MSLRDQFRQYPADRLAVDRTDDLWVPRRRQTERQGALL